MELKDYPSIYQESDRAASGAQKSHFALIRTKVALLLSVGIITSLTLTQTESSPAPEGVVLTMLLASSIALTAVLHMKGFDKTWFSSRTIAESVKAETWLFMMKAASYGRNVSDSEAEDFFLKRLHEIIHSHESALPELAPYLREGPQITAYMRKTRKEPLESRRGSYSRDRIHDQSIWYAQKTKWNKRQESKWFVLTWTLELLAVGIALMSIVLRSTILSPIGVVSTASGGVLSWVNARSYTETTASYGLVAHELSILEDRANRIITEDDMSRIVSEVESAIGQEHRIWLARLL